MREMLTRHSRYIRSTSRTTVAQRSAFNQWLCREIIIWKHLSHVNILPLFGILMSADLLSLRILTEWMPNGNVMQYAKLNPKENRLRLVSSPAISRDVLRYS